MWYSRVSLFTNEFDYSGPRTAPDILNFIGIVPEEAAQSGGEGEESYKANYLKYKAKYLSLKKWADEQGYEV